jgi:CRP-like cAMP-binding protein
LPNAEKRYQFKFTLWSKHYPQLTVNRDMEALKTVLSTLADIPESEKMKFCEIASKQQVAKGENFIALGTIPQKFAFVHKGLFRYYYANEKGNEFTKGFFPENSFIVSYSAMIKSTPSFFVIEALEDSTIWMVDYLRWKELYHNHRCWDKFLISLLEKGYMKKEARERELLIYDAESRYKLFLQEYPELEIRIKQRLIASYLGITPVALSRIRKAMSEK